MDKEKRKIESNITNEYFECYAEFAKTLRTWFIAYGIGAPILFLSNDTIWETLRTSAQMKIMSFWFLSGVLIQVIESLLYKNAMWYLYRGEENPQIKNNMRYKASFNISEYYMIEVLFDIATLSCFIIATYKVICILI